MSLRGIIALAAAIGLLVTASMAQAQYFNFSSQFSPDPVTTSQAGSQINVFNQSNSTGLFANAAGTDIVLTNFSTTSNAPAGAPATFKDPYTITLTLVKSNSTGITSAGDTGVSKTFSGLLSGSISSSTAQVSNSFTGPTSQTFDLGNGQVFTVALTSFTPPGPPSQTLKGAIGAHVFGPTSIQSVTPEPGTLAAFLGLGITSAVVTYRRRRRA